MTEPIRRNVDANGVNLNVYVLTGTGQDPNTTPVVMLHGMRDVGLSLMPIADELASQGTEQDTDGRIVWAFDPRVGSVFADPAAGDSDRYWPHVHCPTCIVSGRWRPNTGGEPSPDATNGKGCSPPGSWKHGWPAFRPLNTSCSTDPAIWSISMSPIGSPPP